MATSDVTICNLALSRLGQAPITALDDGSDMAALLSTFLQQAVDKIVAHHPWNSCLERAELALDNTFTNPDPDGPANGYTLPTDPYCLRVLTAYPQGIEWVVEGRRLLTPEAEVSILYLARPTDYSKLSPGLVEAIAAYLAYLICYPVTEHQALSEQVYKIFKDVLAEARSMDSQEGSTVRFDIDSLVDVRRTGGNVDAFDRNWRVV